MIQSMSYRWLSEISIRSKITSHLMSHNLAKIDMDGNLPQLRIFKKAAFTLMYQLADSTVGLKSTHTVRARQVDFLGINNQYFHLL